MNVTTRPRHAGPAVSPQLSSAIGIARVLSILGIVYVHAWTGLPGHELAQSDGTPQGVLRWTLIELLGRSAVPLLGMVSGWLVANSAAKRPYRQFVAGKARTILLPMVLWNALAILLVCGAAYAEILRAPTPPSLPWIVNELLSVTRANHINVQMPFLRDLFVCMLAAPLLVRLPSPALALIAALAAAWAISGEFLYVLLRPTILIFFVSGILIRRAALERRLAAWPILAVAAPFVVMAGARVWLATESDFGGAYPHLRMALDIVLRFAAALVFWRISWALAATRAAPSILLVEPYMFLMFCFHLILMWFGGPSIGPLTGPLGSPLYPAFLVLQPFLALAASIAFGWVLLQVAPRAAKMLSGGRLKRPVPAPPGPADIQGQGAL
jgi:fucose 4-O-acetylase-like acetyltransferase